MHSGWSHGIFTDLYGVGKMLRNGDLVECERGTDRSDVGNGLLCKRLSPQTLQTQIIGLKDGDRFRNKLRFRTLRLHVSSVLPHEEKDPEVPVDDADIGLSVQVRPANEEGSVFSLTNVNDCWERCTGAWQGNWRKSHRRQILPRWESPSPRPDSRRTFGHSCLVFLQRDIFHYRESLGGQMDEAERDFRRKWRDLGGLR